MIDRPPGEVSQLLHEWAGGREGALEELMPLVYQELRRQASRYLSRERRDHTLGATALVHEAYLKLMGQSRVDWQDRRHFFAIAAQAMRRILVDHARRYQADKREGALHKVALEDAPQIGSGPDVDLLELDRALSRLGELDARAAQVVELRYFAGLTADETAEVMDVSPSTVAREWRMARAWLRRELGE